MPERLANGRNLRWFGESHVAVISLQLYFQKLSPLLLSSSRLSEPPPTPHPVAPEAIRTSSLVKDLLCLTRFLSSRILRGQRSRWKTSGALHAVTRVIEQRQLQPNPVRSLLLSGVSSVIHYLPTYNSLFRRF